MEGQILSLNLGFIPLDGVFEALAEIGGGPETEFLLGPAGIEATARLAVRLAGIPG